MESIFDKPLEMFCVWCGEQLDENGDCPYCGYHEELYDDPTYNVKLRNKDKSTEQDKSE